MSKAFYIFSFLILAHFNTFSQNNVNDYKYIIVPNQYEFLKSKDQYDLNSLTKFLFNKYGYKAYMQDETFPQDLQNNRCLGLIVDVVSDNEVFKSKLRIDLIDCNGAIVMQSQVGESREKLYKTAYNYALREAFKSFQNLKYVYKPNANITSKETIITTTDERAVEQNEITRLKDEIKTLKNNQQAPIEAESVVIPMEQLALPIKEPIAVQDIEAKQEGQTLERNLYAQVIENGYQLVDSSPKIIMVLYKTGAKDVFSVKDRTAVVFKKDNQWILSENNGKEVTETVLNIKF